MWKKKKTAKTVGLKEAESNGEYIWKIARKLHEEIKKLVKAKDNNLRSKDFEWILVTLTVRYCVEKYRWDKQDVFETLGDMTGISMKILSEWKDKQDIYEQ